LSAAVVVVVSAVVNVDIGDPLLAKVVAAVV
jgi:hypothetical protein